MVDFECYYSFPADQVESVEVTDIPAEEMPYRLQVWLKSGRRLVVNYRDKAVRDNAKRILCNRIDTALREDSIQILNKLFLIQDVANRLDKRQLRIWRQLKQLLHIQEAAGDEGEAL